MKGSGGASLGDAAWQDRSDKTLWDKFKHHCYLWV